MAEKGKDLTAEQQLLELIEKENQSSLAGSSKEGDVLFSNDGVSSISSRKQPFFSMEVIKGRIEFLKEKFHDAKGLLSGVKDIDVSIDLANNVLILVICVLFFTLGYEIISKPSEFQKTPDMIGEQKKTPTVKTVTKKEKELQYFLDKINERSLFYLKPEAVVEKVAEAIAPPKTPLELFMEDVKLVGLSPSAGQDPSFIMLESKKTETTIFLEEGDEVDGVFIDKILPDKVILKYKDEIRELR
ncbi:MAG: hypothetical protein PHQ52_02035 [Candidatus Omnitrophica bacterium]|nr:hypothetical protein [Candidatus Omnitrophota bacterium]